MPDLGIVRAELEQQSFVGFEECGAGGPAGVPDQRHPAVVGENAPELGARAGGVEPVERLRRDDEARAPVRQAGRLGRSRPRTKVRVLRERVLCCSSHLGVGLDTDDLVAAGEKKLGGDTRA